jgi:hypothetical protein
LVQHGAQAEGAEDGQSAVLMRGEDQPFAGEAGAGSEQSLDGAAFLEVVEAAEGGQDALVRPAVASVVCDELQVGTGTGLLGAEEQDGLRMRATMKCSQEPWQCKPI